ncbi:hypothetical protein [Methanolapillus millepedarum]|uniref:Uncharacterized protein n=1 Tax=Methanolapillus millepedarum TaxID=3028296 RepID=A0AA96V2P6_9EURY|nr:hypothetical protein MsAc7_03300 [Methanosarcinaceae archaeon Ac7]
MAYVSESQNNQMQATSKYEQTTSLANWEAIGQGVLTNANNFIPILQKRTTAQSINTFGFSTIVNGVDIRGVLQLVVKDTTGAVIPGQIRLYVTNAMQFGVVPVLEDRTERMAENTNQNGYRLGERSPGAKEDSYLMVSFRADVSGKTIDITKSVGMIPITSYMV